MSSPPSAHDVFQLSTVIASRQLPQFPLDALFIHGNVDLAEEMMVRGAQLFHQGQFKRILINGTTAQECQSEKINYSGFEDWRDRLISLKVDPQLISGISPGRHTQEEAKTLLHHCHTHHFKRIAVLTFPYHALRSSLTILSVFQNKVNFYPVTLGPIDWSIKVTKQLLGAEKIHRTRFEMLTEEWQRILSYQKTGDCASFEDLVQYFQNLSGE